MDKTTKTIRIGFIAPTSKAWMGGVNYFKNLFFAVNSLHDKNIEIFIFVGRKIDNQLREEFDKYGKVIVNDIFDEKGIKQFSARILRKLLSSNFFLERILTKYSIDVLSHTFIPKLKHCKTICWIPDFQHMHLPHMFSKKEILFRKKSFLKSIIEANKIILSSYSSLQDFKQFAPFAEEKVEVLQFTSQPNKIYFSLSNHDRETLLRKYKLPENFYFIPNQFWKHKNHLVILETAKLLKTDGEKINFVFSGHMEDPRHKDYISELMEYVHKNELENNLYFLGLVNYEDVFNLIKFSIAVINPSLFEGWSSTVEECKSVGKNLILSDIDVHKEQCPNATFFDRHSASSLKKVLVNYIVSSTPLTKEDDLQIRTRNFGQQYLDIVKDVYYG